MTSPRFGVLLACLLPLLLVSTAVGDPISLYYLTHANGTNQVVQGASVINSWAAAGGVDAAIAVSSTSVRTLPHPGPFLGSEYTLAGAFTGTTYPAPIPFRSFLDGTTDGTFNYQRPV